MPTPRDRTRPASFDPNRARRRFTNRVAETEHVRALLNGPPGTPLPVLMLYGVGGAGKTMLLERLQQECDAERVPWAAVDLKATPEADDSLPRLAATLIDQHGCRFDTFKRVLAVLTAKQTGGATPSIDGRGWQTASQVTDLGLDLLGLMPVVGQLVAVVKLTKKATQLAFRQAMKHGPFRDTITRLGGDAEVLRLIEWDEPQLAAELLRSFAADLVDSLPARPGYAGRAVLFLDTHEALWRDASGGAASQDAWIRQLREYLHDTGVLVVIAGRDHLHWPPDWAAEKDAQGRPVWLAERLVGGLSEGDALEFLHRADVKEWPAEPFLMPEPLRASILRGTREDASPTDPGQHHCYLLELCAQIVANTRATTGEYPPAALFATVPPGDAAASPLTARFLLSLPNQEMVGWLEELSLTPRFDEAFALALDAERRHHAGRAGWRRLRQLSFVTERAGGFFELHALLRESLRARVAPETAQAVHCWAWGQWAAEAGEEDWERRGLAWYHQRFVDHAGALDAFKALLVQSSRAARSQVVRRLVEWWRDVAIPDAPATEAQARDLALYSESLRRLSIGDRAANLKHAIECSETALRVFTEGAFPVDWARTQHSIGAAYHMLPMGDRAANIERAIACYGAALRVRTEAALPVDWAATQNNLGNAYNTQPTGGRAANLGRAIACYEAALRVYTEANFPDSWSRTQTNLGVAYHRLPSGDRAANQLRAIACFEAALRVRTEAAFPYNWARTQTNLGAAYAELPTGDRAANLRRAIASYDAALRVYTEDDFPVEWAWTQHNLGVAYAGLSRGSQDVNARNAFASFESALRVRTEEALPSEWAATEHQRGLAFEAAGDAAAARAAFAAAARGYRAVGDENSARDMEARARGICPQSHEAASG